MRSSVQQRVGFWKWFVTRPPGLACLVILLAISTATTADQPAGVGGKRDVTVMTQNLYVGSSFSPITSLDPADPDFNVKLLTGVATIYGRIQALDFPSRADALAEEIVAKRPDLVALQEVTLLRQQSPGDAIIGGTTPATEVVQDYLRILLGAIRQHGGHYRVVSKVQNLDFELPMPTADPAVFDDVRLTDRDVILARADLPPGYLRTSGRQSGNFTARLPLPIGVEVPRGWCSVEVQVRGRQFRFINAHTEEALPAGLPDIQAYQAMELLAGPANTDGPVILTGDFNSDAYGTDDSTVYPLLTGTGGFTDAWTISHPQELGLTWGHDDMLSDPTEPFIQRLDLILYRGGKFTPVDAEVLDPLIGEATPLWISDHGGVVSMLRIE